MWVERRAAGRTLRRLARAATATLMAFGAGFATVETATAADWQERSQRPQPTAEPRAAAGTVPQLAQAAQPMAFDIPAQDLNAAILAFADKTGIQVFYDTARLTGLRSSPVQGSYTPDGALQQLLAGTGLAHRFTDANTVALEQAAPQGGGPIQLAPVTVLGSRQVDVPLSNVPASITIIDQTEIAAEQPTAPRISDILSRKVPGFNPTNNGVRQIRGRTAQVFINGVPVNEQLRASGGSDINLLSPDQLAGIEVSRGANSAYGFGSPGGIIALETPRADSEELTFHTKVSGSLNPQHPDGSYQTSLYQSAAQIIGDFDFHLDAVVGYDGLEFAPDGEPALGFNGPSAIANAKEFLSGLDGSFGYDFGDAGTLRLSGTFNYADVLQGYEIDGLGTYREIESSIVRYRPDDGTFRRAYTLNLTYENPDIWGSALKLEALASQTYTEAFFPDGARAIRDEQTNEYQGFRSSLTTPLDEIFTGLSVTYGFDFLRNRYFRPAFFDDTDELYTFFSPDVTLDTYAPYLQVELPVGDVRLTGGVRHEEYRGHVDTAIGSGGIAGGDIKPFDLTLLNAGIVYALNDEIDLFATFTQGAEITQIGRDARNAGSAANIDPQPAKSNQYEVGLRGGSRSLDYSLSAFFTESDLLSSLQTDPNNPNGPLIPLREPRKFWGVEGSLDWQIDEQWGIGGVLTWYDGVRKTETGDTRPIGSRDVPPVLVSSYVSYAPFPWWRNLLQLDFRGSRNPFDGSTEFGEGRVDSVALLSLSAAFDAGPGELRIGVRNLLNEKYFSIPAEADNFGFLWIPEEGTRVTVSYAFQW